jgi:hypothetical protein
MLLLYGDWIGSQRLRTATAQLLDFLLGRTHSTKR